MSLWGHQGPDERRNSFPQSGDDLRATAMQAMREHFLKRIRLCYKDPERAIEAEAETINMSNHQLKGYLALIEIGSIHHETAAILMKRVPPEKIPACVSVLVAAHERAVGL